MEIDFNGGKKTNDGDEGPKSAEAPDAKIKIGHKANGPKKRTEGEKEGQEKRNGDEQITFGKRKIF